MTDNFNNINKIEDFSTDNRSDHDEEYLLNLRVKTDKKILDEFISSFPATSDKSLPAAVRWIFGGKLSFAAYISNSSTAEHPNSINFVLSSDSGNKHNEDIIAELGDMTLSIFGYNMPEWFCITRIRRVPRVVGSLSNRVIKSTVTFHYNPSADAQNLPQRLLNRIFELPNILEETKYINQRISHWDEYLKINERIAKEAQLLLDYSGYRKTHNITQLAFALSGGNINSAHTNADIQLVLHTEYENGHPLHKGPIIGTVSSFDSKSGELLVDLDFDFREMWISEKAEIPHKAKLFISKWGDIVQINRLRYGLGVFARGQAANPYLDVFLFDSSKARYPRDPGETLHTGDLLQPNLNPEQKKAVEGVINSDDLYLIQGPPGTGKTTVIAEICYQNAIRGQKTLIASQTNLAVDNALSKLIHHPKIRALRKGNEQSVQEEGKLFTENNVISTWLSKTADDCTKHLATVKAALQKAADAEEKLGFIAEQYEIYNNSIKQRNDSGIQKSVLEHKIEELHSRKLWLNTNLNNFLNSTDEISLKKLIDNPYRAPADFISSITQCYKIKNALDFKRNQIKTAIDTIRSLLADIDKTAGTLKDELQKADKKSEYTLIEEKTAICAEPDFDVWQREARALADELRHIADAKPGALRRMLGTSKDRMNKIFGALIRCNKLKSDSASVLEHQKDMLKELISTNPLSEHVQGLQQESDRLTKLWEEEEKQSLTQLEETEKTLSESKQAIADAREEINSFNSSLPYSATAEAIELVCRKSDICEYYKSLWQKPKDDDYAIASLQEGWIRRLTSGSKKDYDEFKQLYIDNANVIGITCSQSGSKEFTSLYPVFDVAIIDEVSKATPPELILSVLKAKKIVLVGDHKQLPPMLGSDTYEEVAKKLNIPPESAEHMKLSLFEELFVKAPPELKTMLSTQYRMHNQIMESINQFYIEENGFGLRCGLPDPDSARAHLCHGKAIGENEHSLWVDVPLFEENREQRSNVNHSYSNKAECECIKDILLTINDNLTANGYEGKKRIGIISFYSNQVRLMENEFLNSEFAERADKLSLRIGSVDRFQGIECPIVICSFVRNNNRGEIGFAKDPRRVNVALSRAQELSVIVGCTELFCYSNNSPEASAIYKTITQNIFKSGGERSVWDFKQS